MAKIVIELGLIMLARARGWSVSSISYDEMWVFVTKLPVVLPLCVAIEELIFRLPLAAVPNRFQIPAAIILSAAFGRAHGPYAMDLVQKGFSGGVLSTVFLRRLSSGVGQAFLHVFSVHAAHNALEVIVFLARRTRRP